METRFLFPWGFSSFFLFFLRENPSSHCTACSCTIFLAVAIRSCLDVILRRRKGSQNHVGHAFAPFCIDERDAIVLGGSWTKTAALKPWSSYILAQVTSPP